MFQVISQWFDLDHQWHVRYAINGIVSEGTFTNRVALAEFIQEIIKDLRS